MQPSKTTPSQLVQRFLAIAHGLVLIASLAEVGIAYNLIANWAMAERPWQFYAAPLLPLPLLIASLISVRLVRKQKIHQAARLLVAGMIIVSLMMPFLIAGRAMFIVVLLTVIIIALAAMIEDSQLSDRLIVAASASGVVTILLDLLAPVTRPAGTAVRPISMYILMVGTAVFLFYIVRRFNTFQLRMKMILFFMVLPVIIVASITFLRDFVVADLVARQAETAVLADAASREDALVEPLADVVTDLRFLAQSNALQQYVALASTLSDADAIDAARTQLDQEFFTFAAASSQFDQLSYIDAYGQEIARIDQNPDGTVSIAPDYALQNKADRLYFLRTMQLRANEIYISPLELDAVQENIETPHKPVLRYGIPVVAEGQNRGVVIVQVLANTILETLACGDYCSQLVDADGYFLYHPDASYQWGRDLGHDTTLASTNPDLAAAVRTGRAGVLTDDANIYAYRPVTLSTENTPRWYVISQIALADAFGPLSSAFTLSQAVLMIVLLITPTIGLVVSKWLTSPLLKITNSAEKLMQGIWDVDLKINSHDEIGQLAQVFGRMAQQLRGSLQSLEQLTTEQTRDLSLAAEIGRQVAHIRDLDELLSSAAELIRARFDLYYTQIYLLDEQSRTLLLRAGTGEVGKLLLGRQFSLPLSTSSINGTAAIEQQPVIVANTAVSPIFRPNPLLPDTRSEMAVPLLSQNVVVGVLNLQSNKPEGLSNQNLRAFEVLASQLAVAIENAELLTQARQIQQNAESHARQLTRAGWDLFLDGIYYDKYLGYRYTQKELRPLETTVNSAETAVSVPITVVGEAIGKITVDPEATQALTEEDEVLVSIVAQQVGQRLENLRLLNETERFRAQAEEAVRRLTREGWLTYQSELSAVGYQFDRRKVELLPVSESSPTDAQIVQPLQVRGESIGHLAIDEVDVPEETVAEMVTAVVGQLTTHIENLRLASQMQHALAQTEQRSSELGILNNLGNALAAAGTIETIIDAIVRHIVQLTETQDVYVALYDAATDEVDIRIEGDGDEIIESALVRRGGKGLTEYVIRSRQPLLLAEDCFAVCQQLGVEAFGREPQSWLGVPMLLGDQVVGMLAVQDFAAAHRFDEQHVALLTTVASQAAIAINNLRLFQQTQFRAQQEQILREITTRVTAAIDTDTVLRTAAQEIGRALGLETAVYLVNDPQPTPTNGRNGAHTIAAAKETSR